jgi:hypothetical protein
MISLLAWLACAAVVSPSVPGTPALDLVGTWAYVSEEDRHANGTLAHLTPAAGYEGLLVYTSTGYVTAQIYPRGRKWTSASVTSEELRDTLDLSASYFGTYRINASAGEITHHVLAALDPSAGGWDDKKTFTLSGDRLVLKGSWEVRGEKVRYEVTWQRVH